MDYDILSEFIDRFEDPNDFMYETEILNEFSEDESIYYTDMIDDSAIMVQQKRKKPVIAREKNWIDITENENIPEKISFTVAPKVVGSQVSSSVTEPLDFFKLFFTDQFVDKLIRETNDFAKTRLRSQQESGRQTWRDVDRNEFWAFLGVILNMGTMPLEDVQDYWSTKQNSRIPFFSEIFAKNRFNKIFSMLHLEAPVSQRYVHKSNTFLEHINSKFANYFIPGRDICIGESVVKFKKGISFITYNPNKPSKEDVRIYVLADSKTEYVYSILPYCGISTFKHLVRSDLPLNARIPLQLYQNLLSQIPAAKGYHLHTTKYYTSILLAEELLKKKCHLTGIINTNSNGVPNTIQKPQFADKSTVAYKKESVMLLSWKDKQVLTMLSTWHHAGIKSFKTSVQNSPDTIIQKPNVYVNYISVMRGINRSNHYASAYCFLKGSFKWWRKMFFWGMEMCVINSYILYKIAKEKNNEKPLTQLKFVKLLVDQLVGDFRQKRWRASGSASDNRLNGKLHVMRRAGKRDCVVCSNRGLEGGKRGTNDYCDTCTGKPTMHMGDCFYRFHTMEDYKIKS